MTNEQIVAVVNQITKLLDSIPDGQDELNLVFSWGGFLIKIRCYKDMSDSSKYAVLFRHQNKVRRAYGMDLPVVSERLSKYFSQATAVA